MKSLLAYTDSSDQKLYFQTSITLDNKKINLLAATIAGSPDKLNEDSFAIEYEKKIVIAGIFDGTTSIPISALGKISGARYASHFIKDHFGLITHTMSPKQIILTINKQLWKTIKNFKGITLSDTLTLPASTATLIKIDIDKNVFSFSHIGDAFGIVYFTDGHSVLFTDDKNKHFDEEIFSLIHEIAKENGITNREAKQDKRVNQTLGQMYYKRNNNPNGQGSGLINGDPHVEIYIQTGEIDLHEVKAILLGTDGLMPQGWSELKEQDRQQLLTEIQNGGFQKLFETKHTSEDADADWQYARYKHSDDATGLLIQF